jgi:outer membrane autotransporter protein
VTSGTTDTSPKTIGGTDTLTIEKNATLSTGDDTAVILDGASPAPGVSIVNSGTIKSDDRGIDTDGDDNPRVINLTNNKGAVIETGADAFRIDTYITDGKVTIENAGSILAKGGQAFDFDAVESKDAVISIHNAATGSIVANDSDAINMHGGSISVINEGTISSVLSESRGIDIADFAKVKSVVIDNSVDGKIEAFSDTIRIDGEDTATDADGEVLVENRGLIISRGTGEEAGQALDFDKIVSTKAKITINNYASGEIRSVGDDAIRPGEGGVVNNWGRIIGQAPADPTGDPNDDMKSDGIDFQGHAGTVNNNAGGLISGDRHGITTDVYVGVNNEAGATIIGHDGSGVGSDGDGKVVNYGRITGASDPTSVNGDGDGVDIDGHGEITNYGVIEGTGARGIKDGQENKSEGVAVGGGIINNASADALISGYHNGILVDDGNDGPSPGETTIDNLGTIRGVNGFGIKLVGDHEDNITNAGLIAGGDGLAVDMGGGDDALNVITGAVFDGIVDGGAGTDTITLDGAGKGSFGGGVNFETLDVKGGDWTLTNAQSYANGIALEAGRLNVDGTLTGALTSQAGSILAGNGTLDSATIGGTIAPGHSIGKMTFTGNYTQLAGSIYQIEIDANGQSDQVEVKGAATLAGSVVVDAAAGQYQIGTRYTILTAEGGVSGNYDGVTETLPFIDLLLGSDGNSVYFDAERNAVTFASLAVTPNQTNVAAAAESLGTGNAVYDAVAGVPSEGAARAAFNGLSGEIYASSKSVMLEDSRFVRDAVTGRLRDDLAMPSAGGVWGQAYGSWGSFDGNTNTADVDRSIGGIFVGADTRVGATSHVGFAVGYGQASLDVDDRNSSEERDDYHLALYGGTNWGALGVRVGAAYTWHDLETRRRIYLPGVEGTAKSDEDAGTAQVFGEVGYGIQAGAMKFEPFAGIAYVNLDTDGFTERGSAAALRGRGSSDDMTTTTLGLHANTQFRFDTATVVTAHGTLGWRHAFDDVTPTETLAFAGSTSFSVAGVPVAEDTLVIGAGLDISFTRDLSAGISYTGEIGDDVQDHGIRGNLSWKF